LRKRLRNGLTVLTEENHAAPVAALQVWVKVGSADEGPGEAGLAHLHEHMLFKGTGKRPPGQIAREIEGCGGEINAWTSFDETVYHVVVASRFLEQGLDVLADALTDAAFDPDELAREIEVVCEEIKRSEDSPARKLSKDLFAAAFTRHPYGKPVIGSQQSVRSFTREQILRFYRRHYRAENCTLIAVGDFDEARLIALAEQLFQWPEHPRETLALRAGEPARPAPSAVLRRDDVREAYATVAWPAPSLTDPDAPAMDALSIVLGHGEASRLYRALKRDRLLCNDVHASCYTPRDPGLTLLGLTLQPQTLKDAVAEALRQTYRVRHEPITAEELSNAQRLLESDAVYQRETVQGQARKYGFFETGAGGPEFEEEYFARIAALTPESLRDVAERRIDPRQAMLAVLLPEKSADGIEAATLRAWLEEAAEAEAKRPQQPRSARPAITPRPAQVRVAGTPRTGPLLREELPGGGVLLVKEERAVPLVALRAVWPGGLRAEDDATAGTNMLLARLAAKGTAGRDAEQIARAFEAMGGATSGNSGRNSFGLRAELLSKHFDEGLDLFHELLAAPTFRPDEVEREVQLQLQELHTRDDSPSGVAFQLFQETMFTRHPYRLDALGTEAALGAVTPGALAHYRKRRYPPQGAVLAVVGDVDPESVRGRVRALFGQGAAEPVPALSPPLEPSLLTPRSAVRRLDKAQAHLVLGFPGLRLNDPERFPLEVLSAVLSGQGGRLFVELRDKKSLAYSVTSFSVEGVDPGYFAVYIGCSPHKTSEALHGIRAELDGLRQRAPSEAELDRARTHLVGTHAIGLQRNAARAAVYAFDECYGLGADSSSKYAEHIQAVTAEDVLRVARSILDVRAEVVALVAPDGVELK
jgi:zinc protease